jgi:predicted dehydrogenase
MKLRVPPRIGVVGAGRIGVVHACNLAARVRHGRLAMVADVDAAAARRLGDELGVAWTADPDDLVDGTRIDAVVIATPPPTHRQLVTRAAAAGKPVLCEKPLAYDEEDARAGVEAARRAGVPLQVGYHRRFDRAYAAAQTRIAAGELGPIAHIFASMRDAEPPPESVRRRERLVFDATSHDFDMVRWLAGEVVSVTAFGTPVGARLADAPGDYDSILSVLRLASGALAVVDTSRTAGYGFDCRTEIIGVAGTLRVHAPHVVAVERLAQGQVVRDHTLDFLDRFQDAYVAELEAFAAVVGDAVEPSPDGQDGLMATRLAAAADRSLRLGAAVVLGSDASREACRRLQDAGT